MKELFYMRIVIILLLFMPLGMFAQSIRKQANAEQLRQAMSTIEAKPDMILRMVQSMASESPSMDCATYFKASLPELAVNASALTLAVERKSATGFHYLYHQTFEGIPVFGAYLKVNLNGNRQNITAYKHLVDLTHAKTIASAKSSQPDFYLYDAAVLYPMYKTGNVFSNDQDQVIRIIDPRFYGMPQDTTATGLVFDMDPLSPYGIIYGDSGTYRHYNDSNYSKLNDKRVRVSFPATLDSGIFRLESKYAVIQDFALPNNSLAKSMVPSFDYLRGQDEFKDVMGYYHVLHTRDYFMSLGFTNRMQYQQRIDSHSGSGDQSFFDTDSLTLNFGVGGIPDAEDGDVPAHEYTHAMSFDINPTPIMFSERRAIEEGMCDVTAAIQSYKISHFNWRLLFNFDGPIPVASGATTFWGGRNGQSEKTYLNITSDPYKDCEIWTSCLLDIAEHEKVGHDTLMLLMLNSIYHMTKSTTMPQAAQMMLDVDSLLYGGRHQLTMGYFFNLRKFGTFPQAVETISDLPSWFTFFNTEGFADGTGNALLHYEGSVPYQLLVYDLSGRRIMDKMVREKDFVFVPQEFEKGMYFISIIQDHNQYTQKLIRQ